MGQQVLAVGAGCPECGGAIDKREYHDADGIRLIGKCFTCGKHFELIDFISRDMLVRRRSHIINAKGIFRKAIELFGKTLPKPTKSNTLEQNSHILLDIRDKFLSYYALPERREIFEVAFQVLIDEYEHDPHYRSIFDWFVEELVESVISGDWKPRPVGHPSGFWKEPRTNEGNYGNYRGRKFKCFVGKALAYERLEKLVEEYQAELKLTNKEV